MPDRDWYTDNVRLGWRGAARAIERGSSPERVSDLALRAFACEVRRAGGVPGLSLLLDIVCSFTDRMTIPQAFRQLRQVAIQADGSDLTRVAEQAAQSVIASLDRGQIGGGLAREVARRSIEHALKAFLFSPSRLRTVGGRFPDPGAAQDWERQCLRVAAPRIEMLADGLLRYPLGRGLRTPPRLVRREATEDLLFQPIRS